MINIDTNIKDNSLLDNRVFNIEGKNYKDDIILNALYSKVDERKRTLEDYITEIGFQFEDDYQEVPKYQDLMGFSKKSYYGITQHWIGIVEEINLNNFKARLNDKTNNGTYEIAFFEISEVSPSDLELLEKGAIFYWSVGFATDNGQVEKRSLLRFKRSSDFTEEDVDMITNSAKDINRNISWK